MRQFTIGPNEAGQRLDKFLHKYLREAPDSFLRKMLRKKNIELNGKKAEGKEVLTVGDEVFFFLAEETLEKFGATMETQSAPEGSGSPENCREAFRILRGIQILYEDEQLLLADKPAGILSQKAEKGDLSLNEWLLGYLLEAGVCTERSLATFRPSVCNRLDRNTSGLVICGKSLAGSRKMSELLRERTLRKYYRLFVKGRMEDKERVEGWLRKDPVTNQVRIFPEEPEGEAGAKGREQVQRVVTLCEPLCVLRHPLLGEITYLEAELVTGKTHQIRAQLASIGHPLLGDPKYGEETFNRLCRRAGARYQLLHAYRIVFPQMEETFAAVSGRQFLAAEPELYRRLLQESICLKQFRRNGEKEG